MSIEADFAQQNIEALLESMSLEEKIGQLFLLAFSKDRVDEARILTQDHFVGASYVSNDNVPGTAAAVELTRRLQGFAANTRLRIPLILGVDQEGAWSVLTGESCPGPGNMALGASRDPETAYRMYHLIGQEMSAVGLNTIYAPAVDCNSNPYNSIIGMRSFGESPSLVAEMGAAAVRGARAGGVLTTIKHFPGHGDTIADSHRDIPHVTRSREELLAIDLFPFAEGIRAGADMVMTSHIIFDALDPVCPATLSPRILNGMLRDEMGFDGVILSDSMNMQAMKRFYRPADAAIRAFNAGVDLLMLAEEHYNHNANAYLYEQLSLINAVCDAARSGVISKHRLNDAVRRVLLLKQRLQPTNYRPETIGSAEHKAIELDIARKALSFLRGGDGFVPITAAAQLVLVNATTRSSYPPVTQTRGIGPNQSVAAFDELVRHVQARHPHTAVISAEELLDGTGSPSIPAGAKVIAVTENYPLPGMDFDQQSQPKVIARLLGAHPDLIVVALRDPYELVNFPDVRTYLCAFSFRPCAAQAAAEALFGEQPASGKSPVSIPGTGIKATE